MFFRPQILWWQSTVVTRQEAEFIQNYLTGRGKHRQMWTGSKEEVMW